MKEVKDGRRGAEPREAPQAQRRAQRQEIEDLAQLLCSNCFFCQEIDKFSAVSVLIFAGRCSFSAGFIVEI